MTAPRRPTQADMARAIKATLAAGLAPREVRVEPDGTVRVIVSGDGGDGLDNPWDRALG